MKASRIRGTIAAVLSAGAIAAGSAQSITLRPVAELSTIQDQRARSIALFEEAARAIRSPRCLNCHPATRQPTQGNDLHPHLPPMFAGPNDDGVPGMPCSSCHGKTNTATKTESIASIPGDTHWKLAPAAMAWQGKSVREICLQLRDPAQNGGRTLLQVHEHVATDSLVGWAWHPGEGREPAPGTQAQLGALIGAWIATGAECPQR